MKEYDEENPISEDIEFDGKHFTASCLSLRLFFQFNM